MAQAHFNIKEINTILRGFAENLCLTKLELRELKLNIPWASLNSKSVEVNIKEAVISGIIAPNNAEHKVAETKEVSFPEMGETEQTMIQKLLKQISGNIVISIDQLHLELLSYLSANRIKLSLSAFKYNTIDQKGEYIFSDFNNQLPKVI
jgi:hypothetical protein